MTARFSPSIPTQQADRLNALLQERLVGLIDLGLTLKHVHWNVVGPNFIAVHEMLDPQVDAVRDFVDTVAERIATLGGTPVGTPGRVVEQRSWDEYPIGRDQVETHLEALDGVYAGVIADHRQAIEISGDLDPVTEDMLIGQAAQLEMFQWFVRSHLANADDARPVEEISDPAAA